MNLRKKCCQVQCSHEIFSARTHAMNQKKNQKTAFYCTSYQDLLKPYHMNSEKILSIQHWQKIGPCSVFTTFSIIKEDTNALMIFLQKLRVRKGIERPAKTFNVRQIFMLLIILISQYTLPEHILDCNSPWKIFSSIVTCRYSLFQH